MRAWKTERAERVHSHKILNLERHRVRAGDERREVLIMDAPEWINVIPLLDDGRVVMVRQWRYGIRAPTLEIPGGMVDPGEDARTAAARELEEETGYRAHTLRRLGSTHPNPAFITNRISTWLATDLEPVGDDRETFGVHGEEIERETVALVEVPRLIRDGEISHSLVVAGFYLLDHSGLSLPAD